MNQRLKASIYLNLCIDISTTQSADFDVNGSPTWIQVIFHHLPQRKSSQTAYTVVTTEITDTNYGHGTKAHFINWVRPPYELIIILSENHYSASLWQLLI